jgi:23S rRNA pseudouridine1911/1915/1917 synthase
LTSAVTAEALGHSIELVVDVANAGQRADRAIAALCPELSRRRVQQLCEAGRVRSGKRLIHKSALVNLGERITLTLGPPRRAAPEVGAALDVRAENEHWVIVSKPALVPTAPRDATELGTLANALVAAYPEMAELGHDPLEPGLLHRLDNGTSGLLVAARSRAAFEAARAALSHGEWQKSYLAVVSDASLPFAGSIRGELAADPRHRSRVKLVGPIDVQSATPAHAADRTPTPSVATADPHSENESDRLRHVATTQFAVLYVEGPLSLVKVSVGAAFRHQIRVHFAAAGWPLLNDELYGAARDARLPSLRHALHAARVAWAGTRDLPGFDVSVPLPVDLAELFADRREFAASDDTDRCPR